MDLAKALLDKNFHAPTTYFPLLVPECLLIEPTETESKETLDNFVAAMTDILHSARNDGSRFTRTRRTRCRYAGWTTSRPPGNWISSTNRDPGCRGVRPFLLK